MMNREKSMVKNTVILAIGKICTQFISFLLLPIYTALLTTEEYGIVDLMHTYFSLLIPVITLQIEQAVFRYLVEIRENREEKKKLISSVIIGIWGNIIVYVLLFLVFKGLIKNDLKNFLVYNVIVGIFSGILLQIARGFGDNLAYAIASFFTAVVTLLLNIVFVVFLHMGAKGMLTASLIGNFICAVYLIFHLRLYEYFSFSYIDLGKLKEYYRYSIPMVPNGISWWFVSASDRVIISYFIGVGANGIYSAANKFSGVYVMIYNIVNLTWTESATLHINDRDRDAFFTKMIRNIYSLFYSICIFIIAVMPFVFPILIDEKFSAAYKQIPILMIASLFNVVVGLYSVVYIAEKKTNEIAKTSMAAAIINIAVNLIMVRKFGIFAGSVSSLVAYGTMMLLRYFDVQKYVKMRLGRRLVFVSCVMLIVVCLEYYMGTFGGQIMTLIVVCIFALLLNKELIIGGKDIFFTLIKMKHKE